MGLSKQAKIITDARGNVKKKAKELAETFNKSTESAEKQSRIKSVFKAVGSKIGTGFKKGWEKTKVHAGNAKSDITIAYFAAKEARKYRHEAVKREKAKARAEALGLIVSENENDPMYLDNHLDLNSLVYLKTKEKMSAAQEDVTPIVAEEESPVTDDTSEESVEETAEAEETTEDVEATEETPEETPEEVPETASEEISSVEFADEVPKYDKHAGPMTKQFYHNIQDKYEQLQKLIDETFSVKDGVLTVKKDPKQLAVALDMLGKDANDFGMNIASRELPDVPEESSEEAVEDFSK